MMTIVNDGFFCVLCYENVFICTQKKRLQTDQILIESLRLTIDTFLYLFVSIDFFFSTFLLLTHSYQSTYVVNFSYSLNVSVDLTNFQNNYLSSFSTHFHLSFPQ